jgi:hypothetical protein
VTQLSLEGSYLSIIFVFSLEGQQGCCVVLGEADENVTQLSLEGSYAAAVHVGESLWWNCETISCPRFRHIIRL